MSIKALQDYTYYSKYARYNKKEGRRENWNEAIERVKNMHLAKFAPQIQKYPEIREQIEWSFEQSRQKRVLGSQRALQFGGEPILRRNSKIYNCFSANTSFITSQGVKTFADFSDGDKITVLTHKGRWRPAVVKSYGKQKFNRVTINRESTYEVEVTADHRWILKDGTETVDLKEGDRLAFGPSIFNEFAYEEAPAEERLYWAYGYTYSDGTRVKGRNGEYKYSMVRLCGKDKGRYLSRFEELGFSSSSCQSSNGDAMVFMGKYLKTLPDPEKDSPQLIRAFVRGFLDADGGKNKNVKSPNAHMNIQTTGQESIDFIRKCFPIAGVYIVSERDLTGQVTTYGKRTDVTIMFRIHSYFMPGGHKFAVENIEPNYSEGTAWCLEVEDDHSFVMPNGMPTGNCVTSHCDRIRFFQEAFWWLLCGAGVGLSVQTHHIGRLPLFTPKLKVGANRTVQYTGVQRFVIPDSIEGWADSLGVLLASFMRHPEFASYEGLEIEFDYSKIRPEGASISSGGKAPGPEPLRRSLEIIRQLVENCIIFGQKRLRPLDAYDIVMHTSDAVLSGGVRRSATLCLFSPDDEEMAKSKTGNWFNENPQRGRSNNSALLLRNKTTKAQFAALMESVKQYGEPGSIWSDSTELCVNPCSEIGMWPVCEITGESGWSACNLCEQNGKKIRSEEDWVRAATAGSIIGTLQAGYTDFAYLGEVSERIIKREALLGVSITGMMDNPDILFNPELQRKMARLVLRVNEQLAPKLGINPTARATCIKPSGTASCVLGTGSGIHPHHAKRYLRRIQGNQLEAPLRWFKKINPLAVEKSVWSANGTDDVISFCVEVPEGGRVKNDLSACELLDYVKLTQQNWVAEGRVKERCTQPWLMHMVSNTINVKPDEWEAVRDKIYDNRQFFTGVALLPISGDKDYPQAPMCAVLSSKEILAKHGEGSLFASGLIVDGLKAFDGNLWAACEATLGVHPLGEPQRDDYLDIEDYHDARLHSESKADWVRRANQFAERYFGDVRSMTYCLKDVSNLHMWVNLQRAHRDVDYTTMYEESDETKPMEAIACGGNGCELR